MFTCTLVYGIVFEPGLWLASLYLRKEINKDVRKGGGIVFTQTWSQIFIFMMSKRKKIYTKLYSQ